MQRIKMGLGVLAFIAVTAIISSQSSAQILFEFNNDSPFDLGMGIGTSQTGTLEDGGVAETVVNVTTVDLFAPEFADDGTGTFAPTGNILTASGGDGVTTQTNNNSIGVDNPSVSDDDFFAGAGLENRDFNDGEGWVIEFDVDVSFTELNLISFDDGTLTVTIEGMGSFEFVDEMMPGDELPDPFGVDFIPAGTDITFEFSSPTATSANLRINGFTVTTEERPGGLLGDVNLDGEVTFADIQPFIDILATQAFQFEADINGDGLVTFTDIQPFIDILAGG